VEQLKAAAAAAGGMLFKKALSLSLMKV